MPAIGFAAGGHLETSGHFLFATNLVQQFGFTHANALVVTQYLVSANNILGQPTPEPFPLSHLFYRLSLGPDMTNLMYGNFPNIVAHNFPAVLGNHYLISYQSHLLTHYAIPVITLPIDVGGGILVGVSSALYNISHFTGSTLYSITHSFIGWYNTTSFPFHSDFPFHPALPMPETLTTLPDLPTQISSELTGALQNLELDNPVPHNILDHPEVQANSFVASDTTLSNHSLESLKINAPIRKLARRFSI